MGIEGPPLAGVYVCGEGYFDLTFLYVYFIRTARIQWCYTCVMYLHIFVCVALVMCTCAGVVCRASIVYAHVCVL